MQDEGHCNVSFDTTPFVGVSKMIRCGRIVSAKRPDEGYVKVWLCLLVQSSSTEQGKSTIFVKLPAEAPIFRVSDKQKRCVIEKAANSGKQTSQKLQKGGFYSSWVISKYPINLIIYGRYHFVQLLQ